MTRQPAASISVRSVSAVAQSRSTRASERRLAAASTSGGAAIVNRAPRRSRVPPRRARVPPSRSRVLLDHETHVPGLRSIRREAVDVADELGDAGVAEDLADRHDLADVEPVVVDHALDTGSDA